MILRGKELARAEVPKRPERLACRRRASRALTNLRPRLQEKGGTHVPPENSGKQAYGKAYFPRLAYQSALTGVKLFHFSGKSSSAKMAVTGQTGTQAPQSMHSVGWMYSCVSAANSGSSLRGWMQSTGQTSTQAVSFVPMQGSAIT